MHLMRLIYVAVTLCALSVSAEEPAHISDEASEALICRIRRQIGPQSIGSPNNLLRVVYWQTHPGVYGDNCSRVVIRTSGGQILARHDLEAHGGRLVVLAKWSPDSRFCFFTTTSAGGHSPWQFEPYVFSVADRRFRFLGDTLEAVIDPNFKFEPPATVVLTTSDKIIHLNLCRTQGLQ